MEVVKVPEHGHPLKLVDLQLQYPRYEEEEEEEEVDDDDNEGGNLITKEGFHGEICQRCPKEIHMYHRYYYKCSVGSCYFSLHRFCGDLTIRSEQKLKYTHPDTLHLVSYGRGTLNICKRHENCGLEIGKNIIHHPCHPHWLTCAIRNPILCECSACGKRHEGTFYQCPTCVDFTIHKDCAFLPETLLIQQTTHDAFYHTHPLTISYSFIKKDQSDKHDPRCRVCGHAFYYSWKNWIYKCDKCLYYTHLDCATRVPPAGAGKTFKNYKDGDYPGLVHLPFPDDTYSIPQHLFFQQTGSEMVISSNNEVTIQHMSHQHPLILVDGPKKVINLCHDPMKKTQLLCNGCLRPIMSTMPFYTCTSQGCNFVLHEWCTRLPPKIENHIGHPQHTLHLIYSNLVPFFFRVFRCASCCLDCNGFAYCCVECGYYVDVTCGFIPKQITHTAHPNHLLSSVRIKKRSGPCPMCHDSTTNTVGGQLSFHCNVCDVYIHPDCALLLPETIRHKYDKHPMHLSYLPIENHKSQYFCEICEEDLNPHKAFYHCQDCAQSVHAACGPLIVQSETHTYYCYKKNIHYFVNIKFGGIYNTHHHPHPLSFAQGTVLDGQCRRCGLRLQYDMIFRCLECEFAIHYRCKKI